MDSATLRIVIVTVLALAALACVINGARLTGRGDKAKGSRFMLLGAALMLLTTTALLLLKD